MSIQVNIADLAILLLAAFLFFRVLLSIEGELLHVFIAYNPSKNRNSMSAGPCFSLQTHSECRRMTVGAHSIKNLRGRELMPILDEQMSVKEVK